MTVRENLEMGAFTRRDKAAIRADIERVFELFPRLKERERQKAGTLSGGEQQMLAMGRALMARPTLLLLDEPSLGLAPVIVDKIFEIIREINAAAGRRSCWSSRTRTTRSTSPRAATCSRPARSPSRDKSAALRDDERVKAAYLGA